jgi:hypothetical protein
MLDLILNLYVKARSSTQWIRVVDGIKSLAEGCFHVHDEDEINWDLI